MVGSFSSERVLRDYGTVYTRRYVIMLCLSLGLIIYVVHIVCLLVVLQTSALYLIFHVYLRHLTGILCILMETCSYAIFTGSLVVRS